MRTYNYIIGLLNIELTNEYMNEYMNERMMATTVCMAAPAGGAVPVIVVVPERSAMRHQCNNGRKTTRKDAGHSHSVERWFDEMYVAVS